MERDLVQIYFFDTEIWLVGSRTWNGPYRASGAPAVLAASVPSRQLGEAVRTQFFLLKKYTAADENPQFYKHRKKHISWKRFAVSYHLIDVWKTETAFSLELCEMNPDFSFSPDGTHSFSLPLTCDTAELGDGIFDLIHMS